MKRTIIAALAALSLASPAYAAMGFGNLGGGIGVGGGGRLPNPNFYEEYEGDRLVALCGFWGGFFGNCRRLAEREGITVEQAREMGREYNQTRRGN